MKVANGENYEQELKRIQDGCFAPDLNLPI